MSSNEGLQYHGEKQPNVRACCASIVVIMRTAHRSYLGTLGKLVYETLSLSEAKQCKLTPEGGSRHFGGRRHRNLLVLCGTIVIVYEWSMSKHNWVIAATKDCRSRNGHCFSDTLLNTTSSQQWHFSVSGNTNMPERAALERATSSPSSQLCRYQSLKVAAGQYMTENVCQRLSNGTS